MNGWDSTPVRQDSLNRPIVNPYLNYAVGYPSHAFIEKFDIRCYAKDNVDGLPVLPLLPRRELLTAPDEHTIQNLHLEQRSQLSPGGLARGNYLRLSI